MILYYDLIIEQVIDVVDTCSNCGIMILVIGLLIEQVIELHSSTSHNFRGGSAKISKNYKIILSQNMVRISLRIVI